MFSIHRGHSETGGQETSPGSSPLIPCMALDMSLRFMPSGFFIFPKMVVEELTAKVFCSEMRITHMENMSLVLRRQRVWLERWILDLFYREYSIIKVKIKIQF